MILVVFTVINVHTGGRQKPGGNYGAGLFYITLGFVTIGEVMFLTFGTSNFLPDFNIMVSPFLSPMYLWACSTAFESDSKW